MKTWGRDMGDPEIMNRKEGDSKLLKASQGLGAGSMYMGATST
jgi:hypothetical protein